MNIPETAISDITQDFSTTFEALGGIGRSVSGYDRSSWTDADRAARAWFAHEAVERGLDYQRDRNGNLWAWWGDRDSGPALVLGSHLDTVPDGGAYDGALGVVSGFVAVSDARRRGLEPARPVAVAAFAEEEGARFGLPTLGSRLLCGAVDPAEIFDRTDDHGVRLADALADDGLDPEAVGADPDLLEAIGALVELHVEQGRHLADLDVPIAVGGAVWPHGRWRLTFLGEANHAGTTRLTDRRDPTLVLAEAIKAARSAAERLGAVATIGRIRLEPGSTNSIPGTAEAWLDARASHDVTLDELVSSVRAETQLAGLRHGVTTEVSCESRSAGIDFDLDLQIKLKELLRRHDLPVADADTAAGHDAAVLAARVPAAMLFVRNPTGHSHSPREFASEEDCTLGCAVLSDLVADWVGG